MSSAIVKRVKPASLLAAVIFLAVLSVVPATAQAQAGPLGNPTALTATPGPGVGEVTLAWTPAANATRHLVWSLRYDGGDSGWHEAAGDAATLVIDGLDAGQD